jgi:hypothetical protein
MKKSQLKEIIKESLLEGGYSRFYPGGKTPGLSSDVLNKILLRIAQGKGTEEEKYEGDPERGNKILDTADQENVDRILRGEEPQYNEVSRMQELAGLGEIRINNPLSSKYQNIQQFINDKDFMKSFIKNSKYSYKYFGDYKEIYDMYEEDGLNEEQIENLLDYCEEIGKL